MDAPAFVDQVGRSGRRLADAAAGHLDDPVPTCPGWTVTDLIEHLSLVLTFWPAVAAGRAQDFGDYPEPNPPGPDELVAWYRAVVDGAVTDLASVDPTTERWNWTGANQTAGWIQRRMANETAVHAWDGIAAVATPEPLDLDIALDGVDEFLEVFAPLRAESLTHEPVTIHLHATDADGEWLVTAGDQAIGVERGHAKGDVAVRASASDLCLLLWGRTPVGTLETFGDGTVLDRFVVAVRI